MGTARHIPAVLGDIVGDVLSNLRWQSSSYERGVGVCEVEFGSRGLFEGAVLWVEDTCICQVFGS
jgi:hypothetical protein